MTNKTWDESEHPRSKDGKFTFKNVNSDSKSGEEKMQKRADVLYTTMNDKLRGGL